MAQSFSQSKTAILHPGKVRHLFSGQCLFVYLRVRISAT